MPHFFPDFAFTALSQVVRRARSPVDSRGGVLTTRPRRRGWTLCSAVPGSMWIKPAGGHVGGRSGGSPTYIDSVAAEDEKRLLLELVPVAAALRAGLVAPDGVVARVGESPAGSRLSSATWARRLAPGAHGGRVIHSSCVGEGRPRRPWPRAAAAERRRPDSSASMRCCRSSTSCLSVSTSPRRCRGDRSSASPACRGRRPWRPAPARVC